MREERDALIGVAWGESSPKLKGYRNGSYTRDLLTSSGRIEDLQVPRDREGQFHTQVFDRYSRDAPQVAQGLTEMFVARVSTYKVGEVTQTLGSGSLEQDGLLCIVAMEKEKQTGLVHDLGLRK
jgi:putative transposase